MQVTTTIQLTGNTSSTNGDDEFKTQQLESPEAVIVGNAAAKAIAS